MAYTIMPNDDLPVQWTFSDLGLLPISGLSLVMGEGWAFLSQKDLTREGMNEVPSHRHCAEHFPA